MSIRISEGNANRNIASDGTLNPRHSRYDSTEKKEKTFKAAVGQSVKSGLLTTKPLSQVDISNRL